MFDLLKKSNGAIIAVENVHLEGYYFTAIKAHASAYD